MRAWAGGRFLIVYPLRCILSLRVMVVMLMSWVLEINSRDCTAKISFSIAWLVPGNGCPDSLGIPPGPWIVNYFFVCGKQTGVTLTA
ncbi:hypothetical protein BJX62DRAFT_220234 [Aspergillus germanicus]